MSKLRFSVIVPVYNTQEYIDRMMNSILEQMFLNYEIILIENASTDSSAECVLKYKNCEKIRIFQLPVNKGTGGARNVGIEKATGEYIVFIDSDDMFFDCNVFTKIDELIGRDKPDIVYLGYQENGGENNVYLPTDENSSKKARIRSDITTPVWSKAWRREFLLKNNFKFEENMYFEDMAFSFRGNLISKSYKYGAFPIIKYTRQRQGSLMSLATVKRCSDLYHYMACVMELYPEVPSEYREDFFYFMGCENAKMESRIKTILQAMEEGRNVPIQKKRG